MHVEGTATSFKAYVVGRFEDKAFLFQINSDNDVFTNGGTWTLGGSNSFLRSLFEYNSNLYTVYMSTQGTRNNL